MAPGLPKPGTLRFELLAALVRNDHADTDELMRWCDPPPRFRTPIRSAWERDRRTEELNTHCASARRRISKELSYLSQRGLVEGVGPAELAPWVVHAFETEPTEQDALERVFKYVFAKGFVDYDPHEQDRYALDADDIEVGEDEEESEGKESPGLDAARVTAAIVLVLLAGPRRRCEVALEVQGSKKESGAFQRAWARVVLSDIVMPSSQRRPTQAGRDYIAEHRAKAAACAS